MNKSVQERPGLVLMVGLPGTGKTTAREKAIAENDIDRYVYSTDDLIEQYAVEMEVTYSEAFPDVSGKALHEANRGLKAAIAAGRNVLWDQTNLSRKKRAKALKNFPDEYRKDCICVLPPMNEEQEDELEYRLGNRPGKVIPYNVMAQMRDSFQLPSMNEGFNRVFYFDMYGNLVDRNYAADLFGDG